MGKTYFVSGIDTSVGKTVATGLMAKYLLDSGRSAITVKPVQTGNTGFSEDIAVHRAMCGGVRYPEDEQGLTAPQIFAFPSSPELAARLEGRVVDVAAIDAAVEKCAQRYETVLVESAGGLAVPLSGTLLSVDWAAAKGWPLVLVTSSRLGSLNHTILSLEAAFVRGMDLAGVVYNTFPAEEKAIEDDTRRAIADWLAARGRPAPVVDIPEVKDGTRVDFGEVLR